VSVGRLRLLPLAVALLATTACMATRHSGVAEPPPPPTVADPTALSPLERYTILRGTADEPFAMVENALAAGDAFLRVPSAPVRPGDPAISHLADRMAATVLREQGVGIAAPQVGIGRRVVIVQRFDLDGAPMQVLLNPAFVDLSAETALGWEGCLSIPAGFGEVERSTSGVVEYDTPEGIHEVEPVQGFTAVILQHEIDHLDGVLFIDRTATAPLMPKEEYRQMRAREQGTSEGE
jgi:peptide deformylase